MYSFLLDRGRVSECSPLTCSCLCLKVIRSVPQRPRNLFRTLRKHQNIGHHFREEKEAADLKLRRSSALSSRPSLCQVILGEGTALKGTGMCSFSVSTTTRSRVWKSRVGLPGNKARTHTLLVKRWDFSSRVKSN